MAGTSALEALPDALLERILELASDDPPTVGALRRASRRLRDASLAAPLLRLEVPGGGGAAESLRRALLGGRIAGARELVVDASAGRPRLLGALAAARAARLRPARLEIRAPDLGRACAAALALGRGATRGVEALALGLAEARAGTFDARFLLRFAFPSVRRLALRFGTRPDRRRPPGRAADQPILEALARVEELDVAHGPASLFGSEETYARIAAMPRLRRLRIDSPPDAGLATVLRGEAGRALEELLVANLGLLIPTLDEDEGALQRAIGEAPSLARVRLREVCVVSLGAELLASPFRRFQPESVRVNASEGEGLAELEAWLRGLDPAIARELCLGWAVPHARAAGVVRAASRFLRGYARVLGTYDGCAFGGGDAEGEIDALLACAGRVRSVAVQIDSGDWPAVLRTLDRLLRLAPLARAGARVEVFVAPHDGRWAPEVVRYDAGGAYTLKRRRVLGAGLF